MRGRGRGTRLAACIASQCTLSHACPLAPSLGPSPQPPRGSDPSPKPVHPLAICPPPLGSVPLEIKVVGDKAPVYDLSLEDLGRYNETPVLPFNAYGTLAWARAEFDNNSASSQVRAWGAAAAVSARPAVAPLSA